MPNDRQNAYLLALEGHTPEDIGERLGVSPEVVEAWLFERWGSHEQRRTGGLSPDAEREDHTTTRQALARTALAADNYLNVASGDDILGDADVGIGFRDDIAVEFSDLVDDSAHLAASFPGVRRATREDREFVAIYGKTVDTVALESSLRHWWRVQLLAIIDQV